ncbi:hypothetical protein K469DRAFT_567776 [Zopfia rhizophila CBS 207.26]|uniref:Cyclin N-terminal domain-containing protein n=1 Tax=Zopfia rhizophila CBS 207.26 TaxID=1314779 RepID=A0A6A6E7Q4_9PEZI|nr:hypothetical protein K469DRAFT_567776 [Zopfia rhizophila CBS 207.26]
MDYSPALSVTSDFSDFTDEELEKYFASYVPLSNLPTPPPAKDNPIVDTPNPTAATEVHRRTPELEAYATHLANLVPSNISVRRPSTATIYDFLIRAKLPPEFIAFGACILDALTLSFAATWRTSCLPPIPAYPTFNAKLNLRQPPAVDPEIIVLSALALAHDFLHDRERTNSHWAQIEGNFQFTSKQIDATKGCILRDIQYSLFRLTDDIPRRLQNMQHTSKAPEAEVLASKVNEMNTEKDERKPKLSLDLQGTAVWKNGMQTPEPSP